MHAPLCVDFKCVYICVYKLGIIANVKCGFSKDLRSDDISKSLRRDNSISNMHVFRYYKLIKSEPSNRAYIYLDVYTMTDVDSKQKNLAKESNVKRYNC